MRAEEQCLQGTCPLVLVFPFLSPTGPKPCHPNKEPEGPMSAVPR